MFKFFIPFLLLIFVALTGFQTPSIQTIILEGLKTNDSKAIVKHFGSSVNLSLKGEERIASKFQSELMIHDFLKDNPIKSVKVNTSGGNKQSATYTVYVVTTAKESVQVAVKFMEIKGETAVVEFKIY